MVDVQRVIQAAREGKTKHAYVVVGTETFLVDRAISALRAAAIGSPNGFNDDTYQGKGLDARSVIAAANTLPMMSPARFVLVRHVDKVDTAGQAELATFLADPSPIACVVLTAAKLNGNSKLARAAKKAKCWVEAKAVKRGAVRDFVREEAKARGHVISGPAASLLVDAIGEDLSLLDDALERLSLYVGDGQKILPAHVTECISRVRVDSIWALVDAVSGKDAGRAIAATASLLADREPPLRILAMVSRQLRMVARMRQALAGGARGSDATSAAGAPPFKARELTEAARRFTMPQLTSAFRTLAEADLALKGSKQPPSAVLENAILALCR